MEGMDLRGVASPRRVGSRGGLPQLVMHFGMLLATLAFASWWTTHTILDTSRTRKVTDAVLENADVRNFVAGKIASITTPAVGAETLSAATGTTQNANPAAASQHVLGTKLSAVLQQPDVRAELETFVTDAHDQLIGSSTKPAVLDQSTVRTLVAAALPTLPAADLDKVNAVHFAVPRVGPLSSTRSTLAHRFWVFLLGAVLLLGLAIATTRDRRSTLRIVGTWLIGISVAHLVVLWILPVVIVPRVSSSPWADLIASVARALDGGLVVGLVVLAGAGVALLIADRFVRASASSPAVAPSTLAARTMPER